MLGEKINMEDQLKVLNYCSWFTFTPFLLNLRTFVAKSALSHLRALGGTFWPKLVGGGTKTFSRTGSGASGGRDYNHKCESLLVLFVYGLSFYFIQIWKNTHLDAKRDMLQIRAFWSDFSQI